ncbi:MAG: hypothetical protein KAI98_03535 [Gemmatimonadetes bacterium]|nr:hypothetical protein [Gemmatimonadota bacterium]
MNPLLALAANWRSDADRYERDEALVRGEAVLRRAADELEAAWNAWQLEELTVAQAANESGYTISAIEKQLRWGRIPNAGEAGRPRIRRSDLPRKAGRRGDPEEPDLAGRVLGNVAAG